MDDANQFALHHRSTLRRPLLGLTILAVEDSRYACDAMRLLCLRSGARIRRADSLRSARRHLEIYRPSVAIVDVGLPDGSGLDLIADLAEAQPRVAVILGTSGDDMAEAPVMAAGADGFLAKPQLSVASFQRAITDRLPPEQRPRGLRLVRDEVIRPDPAAYLDDMAHVADVLGDGCDADMVAYVAQFVTGLARSAGDTVLSAAARHLNELQSHGKPVQPAIARLGGIVQNRLAERVAM